MTDRPLTARIDRQRGPLGLAGYQRAGGYDALRHALRGQDPQQILDAVTESKLRGRGGAGFPTGKKWSFVPRGDDAPPHKHLVVNADEMEPGTFKDRFLLEGDPHRLIEGVILSAFAIGADSAYIFLRGEYLTAARRLSQAIREAEGAGLLGRDILGSGFHLDLPMDFDTMMEAGSRLGTGTMIVLDDQTCPVGLCLNLERFFAQESCGWCTPCRDGLPYIVRMLAGLGAGDGTMDDIETLEAHTGLLGMGNTFCAHAPGAMEPLQSALKYFREDFERHVSERRCPYRVSSGEYRGPR